MRPIATILMWLALAQLGGSDRASAPSRFGPAEILRNMPVNSDFRCTGIALVAEALLEGELIDDGGCDRPDELGRLIYENASKQAQTRFRSKLCLNHGALPIQSREALDRI